MLSMWFKVLVVIIAGFQCLNCNFDEFVEDENPLIEDVDNTNENLTTGHVNRKGIFHGIHSEISGTLSNFSKHIGSILPKVLPSSESTTSRILTAQNENYSPSGTQLPSGPTHGTISQSISTLIRLPYEGAQRAKNRILNGNYEGGLRDGDSDPSKEHGNMERFGREFVRKIANAFGRTETQGLDTNKTFFNGVMVRFKDHVHFIYPGTVWCGEGDIAGKMTDLGMFAEPDKCCRAHDKCYNFIEKGEKKYGLENTGMFTRCHCSCDRSFHKCLEDSKSMVGTQIGFTYFTVLGPQCFEEKQKIEGCDKIFKSRCIQYNFNEAKDKKYQWFDNPTF